MIRRRLRKKAKTDPIKLKTTNKLKKKEDKPTSMNSTSPSFLLEMTKIPDWEIPLVQENLEMMKVNPTKELKKKKLSISNFSSFTMKKPKPNIQIGPHPKLLRSFHCFGKRKKTSKKLLQKPIQQLQEDQINPLHQRMRSD